MTLIQFWPHPITGGRIVVMGKKVGTVRCSKVSGGVCDEG